MYFLHNLHKGSISKSAIHFIRLEKFARDKRSSSLGSVTKEVKFMKIALSVKFITCIFFVTSERSNKLERHITLGWKSLTGTNTLAYWSHSENEFYEIGLGCHIHSPIFSL